MKRIIFFQLWHGPGFENLTPDSNSLYIKNYESWFDEVHVVRLVGKGEDVVFGHTKFKTLGTGKNKIDFLLAPFRLLKYARAINPDVFITYEQVWLWWIAALIKIFSKRKIILIPVTIPEAMYKYTGKSLSLKYPIWIERKLTKLSYRIADYALTPKSFGSYVDWLINEPILHKKVIIADKLPESIPAPCFFDNLEKIGGEKKISNVNDGPYRLIYVGRLHREKLVDHLVKMMAILSNSNSQFELTIIGDGDEKGNLIELCRKLKVEDKINFIGYVDNARLPFYYLTHDCFVSPLTGNSLREAALCGLPIVAYKIDWITNLLIDEENYLAVPANDYATMAAKVIELHRNRLLNEILSENIKRFAWDLWSPLNLRQSMSNTFGNKINSNNRE